ncbi:transglycosylase domain-containing protein [Flavobacterium sp. GCM10027622]|uniref:transglycosylase domain-containing protein n=1 Tax=unclassified Flavobacterium TaxID=196869 RepID=UPI00360F3421
MKKLTLIVFLGFILTLISYFSLLSDYNPMFNNEEFTRLKLALKKAEHEDLSSLVDLYNIIYEAEDKKNCPCEVITKSVDPFRHQISPRTKIYSLKAKKDFGHDNCLKIELLQCDYLHGTIGVKSAANYYFNKSLKDLNEKEKITLLVMLENPALYNPKRRKEKVEEKVKLYQNIIAEKKAAKSSILQ